MNTAFAKNLRRLLGLASLATLVAACSSTPGPTAAVTAVTIVGGDQAIDVGATRQLTVDVTATGGASTAVTWSTSDDAIVTVDGSGAISGVAVGVADVTATSVASPSVQDTIRITVSADAAVTDVTIQGGDRPLELWEEVQLSAAVAPASASQDVTWSSSAPDTVSVVDGLITAVAADGVATITATSSANPEVSGSIDVTVAALPAADPASVHVDASVPPGGNGHVDFPFRTITDGIVAVQAGGDVNVRAGTYEESLYIDKSLNLLGAGVADVNIVSDENAPGTFSGSAIDIDTVDGLTLSGFRLDVVTPGPSIAAIGMLYAGGSQNVTIEDVDIHHTNDARITRGVAIADSTGVTLRNMTIVATGGGTEHAGAGVLVSGDSTTIEIDGIDTEGHESFAGIALVPGDAFASVSGVSIVNSTFAEVNKLTVGGSACGTVTNLTAPVFVAAVGNPAPVYGGGCRYFYKDSVEQAVVDSLFNFNELDTDNGDLPAWIRSTVRRLTNPDRADRPNDFVVASAEGDSYGYTGAVRSHLLQAAIDAIDPAAGPATLEVWSGTYAGSSPSASDPGAPNVDGATTIPAGVGVTVAIQRGDAIAAPDIPVIGDASATGSVFTIDADDVSITGLQIEAPTGHPGIAVGAATGTIVSASNLLGDVAIDNVGNVAVVAEGNWWGAASGPSGTGHPGTGSEIVDPVGGGAVDADPFAGVAFD